MARSNKSIKNMLIAFVGQCFGLIISFIARIVFIRILGKEYLGLNGLFTNILTMLSLAELGIGEAITFSLYKPLAKNDIKKTKMIMQFYRKVYKSIGFVVLILGILIAPFIKYIIEDIPNVKENIYLIYILFVCNTAISYFFSYKRNLIIADQNRYIASIYRYVFYFLLNFFQIVFLIITRNYIIFLILQIIATFLENISISDKANKMYPFLKEKDKISLDKSIKKEITKNTKAMMLHKVGGLLVSSTDNILLAKFVSIVSVGIYSNYFMIISALNTIFGQIFSSLNASVGNLFVTEHKTKSYEVFQKINFISFWIFSLSSILLICLFNDFITLWLGKEYIFSYDIVLVLVINFYITGLRKPVVTFKEAAGLFYYDRWKSIIEAIINLIVSIILAIKLGTVGVFLGTFISSISVCVWVEPYVLFKYGFNLKLSNYFKTYFKYLIIVIFLGIINFSICYYINLGLILGFFVKIFVCLFISNVCLYIIFRKKKEFLYLKSLMIDKSKIIFYKMKRS